MKLLLDTHAFLWFIEGNPNLSLTAKNAIDLLEIQPQHLDILAALPFHHKDPFDRLILSQGLAEKIPIITKDNLFSNYPVTLIW
ncbi:MAG: type II toxin-antitoxin system VapC family toxin [Pseudanabaena sp.]